jgi:hypothetical protein
VGHSGVVAHSDHRHEGRLRPKGLLTREELQGYNFELRQAYHEIVDALMHPKIPVLQNTDFDPLELTPLTYTLTVPASNAVERLIPLAMLRDEAHITDETYDAAGALVGSGSRHCLRATARIVLGAVTRSNRTSTH